MLSFTEYKDVIDPLKEGDQIHVNHEGCGAGTDTKKRLYLKRIEGGKVLGYCHHCGEKGILKGTRTLKSLASLKEPFEREIETGNIVPQFTKGDQNLHYSPPYFNAWLTRMGYYEVVNHSNTGTSKRQYLVKKVGYHQESARIYVPIYQEKLRIVGYQSRCINPAEKTKAKWLTVRLDGEENTALYSKVTLGAYSGGTKVCHIVVEDLISHLVLWENLEREVGIYPDMQIILWCSMGVQLPTVALTQIHRDISLGLCSRPIVWYDNDKAGAHGKAKIARYLGVQLDYYDVMRDEPKNLGYYELSTGIDTMLMKHLKGN